MHDSASKQISTFSDILLSMDRIGANKILCQLQEEHSPLQIVESLIVPALENIGRAWEKGDVALAQIYMASRICEELVDLFLPPTSPERSSQPQMAIALLDDYHALGKMIVYTSLRASGYELQDYGRVTTNELVQRVCDDSIQVVLISTLMLRSALQVKDVKNGLIVADSHAKVIVGGAPFRFDPELWQEVGADGMGATAGDALIAVSNTMKEIA